MRKHSTWLWGIIIVVVIFTFVIWGTNTGRQGGGRIGTYGRINGKEVTEEALVAARTEVTLRYFLRFGELPDAQAERQGFDMEREVYSLLLLLQQLEERRIQAGAEAKAVVAANMLRSLDKPEIRTLADLEQAVLRPRGFKLADLDRLIGHQIAVQQLTAVEGLPGQLITPSQVRSLWIRENEEISAQAVFVSASNYLDSVTVTPEALTAYFTNQMARYRIPDRLQVNYVAYPISNYVGKADERLAAMTNLTAGIDNLYAQRLTNDFFAGYTNLTPDEAKAEIREEVRRDFAVAAARQEAAVFANELYDQEVQDASALNVLAAQKGLAVKVSEPFDRSRGPADLKVGPAFADAAFRLRDDEPFGGPIAGEDHVFVITLNQRIPSVNARFEDVKDRVSQDYRFQQAVLMARNRGNAFAEGLTNGVVSGEAFAQACAKAGYKAVRLEAVSRSTPTLPEVEAHVSLGLFKQVAFNTPVGTVSRFNFTSDGGYVVYVGSRLPLNEAKLNEELPAYTRLVRQTLENDAFNTWFSQAAQVGLQETPLSQRPPPQVSSPGG
ncbi:MAG: SurA N-terminal domain-containing protein [Verrucomicrobia bacterium]|nr:SurA N-terminal domain-containing protein [Verrucomicrobiota bacterium]